MLPNLGIILYKCCDTISDTEDELNRLIVIDKGELHDPADQIFSKEAIVEKTKLDNQNKLSKSVTSGQKRRYDNNLENYPSIVPKLDDPKPKKINLEHQDPNSKKHFLNDGFPNL